MQIQATFMLTLGVLTRASSVSQSSQTLLLYIKKKDCLSHSQNLHENYAERIKKTFEVGIEPRFALVLVTLLKSILLRRRVLWLT